MTIPISCDNIINASNRRPVSNGEMSERFKELVLKTSDPKGPWVRIPLSPPFSYDGPINSDLEKYPSGRRGSPAKGVGRVERREGSNPSFSAKRKALIFNGSRLFFFLWTQKSHRCSFPENFSLFQNILLPSPLLCCII